MLDAEVEQFACRLYSRLDRVIWRLDHGRKDNEIVARWLLRCLRRAGGCEVGEVDYQYRAADDAGPRGLQTGKVMALRPATVAQRRLFTGLRLPPELHVFRFMDPDHKRNLTIGRWKAMTDTREPRIRRAV